jgi:hypothetical protein
VDKAIKRGIEYLKKGQNRNGEWPEGFRLGATALAVYTLLKCDVPVNDPVVDKGLKYLCDVSLDYTSSTTYEISLLAMALATALEKTEPGKSKTYVNQNVKPRVYKLQEVINWLIRAQHKYSEALPSEPKNKNKAGQPKPRNIITDGYTVTTYATFTPAAWRYQPNSRDVDNSCTQFALLGLRAGQNAHDLGFDINIPKSVWQKAIAYLLGSRESDGGWGYIPSPQGTYTNPKAIHSSATINMTAGGLSGLIICLASLESNPSLNKIMKTQEIIQAVQWFEKNYQLPDDSYGLYSIERAGMLGGITKMGNHDWYEEGKTYLLSTQLQNGSWNNSYGPTISTCFDLLFLKKAYIHVIITPSGNDAK